MQHDWGAALSGDRSLTLCSARSGRIPGKLLSVNFPCASSIEVDNTGDVQKQDGYAVPKLRNAGRMDFLGPFPAVILCVQLPCPFSALSQDQGFFLLSSQLRTRVFHKEQGWCSSLLSSRGLSSYFQLKFFWHKCTHTPLRKTSSQGWWLACSKQTKSTQRLNWLTKGTGQF